MKRKKKFVVCIWNADYPASLDLFKIYEQLPDATAERHGLIRIADEEDNALYPARHFVPIELPHAVEEAFDTASELQSA
ncbi:MAG: hypothetical protein ACRD3D_13110 [Terriglobia bacterium]